MCREFRRMVTPTLWAAITIISKHVNSSSKRGLMQALQSTYSQRQRASLKSEKRWQEDTQQQVDRYGKWVLLIISRNIWIRETKSIYVVSSAHNTLTSSRKKETRSNPIALLYVLEETRTQLPYLTYPRQLTSSQREDGTRYYQSPHSQATSPTTSN